MPLRATRHLARHLKSSNLTAAGVFYANLPLPLRLSDGCEG